jgi:hypothetical protein
MVGDVIDAYLALLGMLLAGVTIFVMFFVAAMAQGPTGGRPVVPILAAGSTGAVIVLGCGAIAVAAALLAPVLVAAVAMVVLVAMGYTVWWLLRYACSA